MLRVLRANACKFDYALQRASDWRLPEDASWIDLHNPTREEELAVEEQLGVELPTREEMAEIEVSSRLYKAAGATIMTATVLCGSESQTPTGEPITFALVGDKLVTIRYAEPHSFKVFADQVEKQPLACASGRSVFLALLDAIVDRTADILERTGAEVEGLSRAVFARPRTMKFEDILTGLGHAQDVGTKVRESLVSLARLISFAGLSEQLGEETRQHLKILTRDVQSVTDHASYVSGNVTFLLDAALGLINIEQNAIIKIFSVAAVVFMPPTLIASIYGMNFHHMPELDWRLAYPAALCAMVASAILPILWFQRKGWLK
jgi:magnesium transporter